MPVPLSQWWAVASHVLSHQWRRQRHYPLVLMLEPLFRCNLACRGCGKVQRPGDELRMELSLQECLDAAEECGAPIVSLAGGEPLLHEDMPAIVDGLVSQGRYVYLCTNALLLEKRLEEFTPSKYLSFSVHVDGPAEIHDRIVDRPGTYDKAISAIRAALGAGFRVTTNTTLFAGSSPELMRSFFDELMAEGVEGFMVSPGFDYSSAEDQESFLKRDEATDIMRRMLGQVKRRWRFNQSPLFLEMLRGRESLPCTPWGSPTRNPLGWQRPCYLREEGYCDSFKELIETTDWSTCGPQSGVPECENCMLHSGFEPSAVTRTFGTMSGFLKTARIFVFGLPNCNGKD